MAENFVIQLCVAALFAVSWCEYGLALDMSCVEVKNEYRGMGFRDDNVPVSEISGK